jgi:hypothetical protein
MLPRVAIARPNAAVTADVEQYRLLVGDELVDEVATLARVTGAPSSIQHCREGQ